MCVYGSVYCIHLGGYEYECGVWLCRARMRFGKGQVRTVLKSQDWGFGPHPRAIGRLWGGTNRGLRGSRIRFVFAAGVLPIGRDRMLTQPLLSG